MRESCFSCVRKHLGSAAVFIKETKMGYPDYDIYALGELEHAADECLRAHPSLAGLVREHRLAFMDDPDHAIPFEELNRYIKCCTLAENGGNGSPSFPKIPEECLGDLPADASGNFEVHGDTRP